MTKNILANIWAKIGAILLLLTLTSCQGGLTNFIYYHNTSQPKPIPSKVRVALVLGGGGARSIAQIGAIEVLEENNIPIDIIVGSSAGSMMGALYADKQDIKKMKKIGLSLKKSDLVKASLKDAMVGTVSLRGGLDGSAGEKFITDNVKATDFKDLKIPLIAVATDLISGKTIGIRSGKIALAIRASCAIPGLFSPIEMNDMVLVDGCVTAPLPVLVAKEYSPEIIIAIDVSCGLEKADLRNMFDVAHRAAYVSYDALNELNGKSADIWVRPILKNIGLFEDQKNEELYLAGRKAMTDLMPRVKLLLKEKEPKRSFLPKLPI